MAAGTRIPDMARRLAVIAVLAWFAVGCGTGAGGPGPPTAPGAGPCSPPVSLVSFSDALDETTFADRYVGNLSGLAPEPDGRLLAVSDRSVVFTLAAAADRPLAAVPVVDATGRPLDAEAIVVDRDGTWLIASETGPAILRFDPQGRLLEQLPVPPELRVAPAGRGEPNGTVEGLALQPDGRTLVASVEEPLRGDPPGTVRFATWTRPAVGAPFVPDAQYAVERPAELGVSDIAATGDGRLLVLERGVTRGVGNTVHLALADLRGATDLRGPGPSAPPAVVRPVLLADLASCPASGATARQPQPNPLLDNVEGMAIRPGNPADVLLVSDDNQEPAQTTRTYRLQVALPPA